MHEHELVHPEVAAALRAYELEIRDGTERSQQEAFRKLQAAQRTLGGAAVAVARQAEPQPEADEQQLAAG